jgi:DNA repair protein RecO
MAPQKSEAIVLKCVPFRESSLIIHLFTKEHGLVHAIAKGIKGNKKGQNFLERGFIIELVLYIKSNRDLHTASTINVIDFFSDTRQNIVKGSLRDTAFEVIMSVIHGSDEHPELYDFFRKFLLYINNSPEEKCFPAAIWLFYYRFIEHMGIAFNLNHCITCNTIISDNPILNIQLGGLQCPNCSNSKKQNAMPLPVISYLKTGNPKPELLKSLFSKGELLGITNTLSNFIRYHFEVKSEYRALSFLGDIV